MKKFIFCLTVFFLCLSNLQGEEWIVRGSRARAMGGAQVAISRGTMSAYWNPAAFAFRQKGDKDSSPLPIDILIANVGLEAVVTGNLAKDIYDLKSTIDGISGGVSGLQSRLSGLTATSADVNSLLNILDIFGRFDKNSSKGIVATVQGEFLDVRVGSFALTSQLVVFGGINPVVQTGSNNILGTGGTFGGAGDLFGFNIGSAPAPSTAGQTLANDLVTLGGGALSQAQADAMVGLAEAQGLNVSDPLYQKALKAAVQNTANSTGSAIDLNNTGIIVKGLALAEVRGSYAMEIIPKMLAIGGNIKIMQGTTFNKTLALSQMNQVGTIFKEVWNEVDRQRKQTVQFSVDLGVLLDLGLVRVGLTGRNLIPTRYETKIGKDFELQPQARAGVAVTLGWITAALDLDLNPNGSDSYDKFNSQLINFGVEVVPLDLGIVSLALRAGIFKNLAEPGENEIYTAGFGLRVWLIQVDFAIALDSKAIKSGNLTMDFKNKKFNEIPDRVGFSGTISMGFNF